MVFSVSFAESSSVTDHFFLSEQTKEWLIQRKEECLVDHKNIHDQEQDEGGSFGDFLFLCVCVCVLYQNYILE